MSYFDQNPSPRISWNCSIRLKKYFKNIVRGTYFEEDEYVATWYDARLSHRDSKTLTEVTFINLTNPIYEVTRKENKESITEIKQSFIVAKLPINFLHKIPFGSIWKGGESNEKFQLKEYTVTFSATENLTYQALWRNENHPFETDKYVHSSSVKGFNRDGNNLLVINQNNISYIIHPLHFFMAHYGYSSELKRILATYNWEKIEELLHLNEQFDEKGVFFPENLSENDVVFLYHLKYDEYTKQVVKTMNAEILKAKRENNSKYSIHCWHKQPITISFYGIPLGNSVLCCQIKGINQPQGESIKVYYHSYIRNKGESSENGEDQYRTQIIHRKLKFDKIDISQNNVNNLITSDVIEKLQLLGEKRKINKIALTHEIEGDGRVKFLGYDEPTDFGVGEKQGKTGYTGIADCFYDIIDNQDIEGYSRLETIWEHAKRLCDEQGYRVCWYSPEQGFQEHDNFRLIDLRNACNLLKRRYPLGSLVLRIEAHQRTFFVISFPEKMKKTAQNETGFSSIVYEPENIQEFLYGNTDNEKDTLVKILVDILIMQNVSSDYVDSKDGRMTTFIHRRSQTDNNNWVWNGIKKLL